MRAWSVATTLVIFASLAAYREAWAAVTALALLFLADQWVDRWLRAKEHAAAADVKIIVLTARCAAIELIIGRLPPLDDLTEALAEARAAGEAVAEHKAKVVDHDKRLDAIDAHLKREDNVAKFGERAMKFGR